MNEQIQGHGMSLEELQSLVTEMKVRTCDYYRSVDMAKAQLSQTEQELNQQLQELARAEQELQKMQREATRQSMIEKAPETKGE